MIRSNTLHRVGLILEVLDPFSYRFLDFREVPSEFLKLNAPLAYTGLRVVRAAIFSSRGS